MGQNLIEDTTGAVFLAPLLARLAEELRHTVTRCTELQWTISALLDRVEHPDLGEEIHMLQDIDRMQQVLADIAALVSVASAASQCTTVPLERVGSAIRLESFRNRIGLDNALNAPTVEDLSADEETGRVTWL